MKQIKKIIKKIMPYNFFVSIQSQRQLKNWKKKII
jgi:hypothetical protein